MMSIYAIVENGVVKNIVLWDGQEQWQAPAGSSAVVIPEGAYVGIGSTYSNGVFSAPPQPPIIQG
jgi:hypothetical protein